MDSLGKRRIALAGCTVVLAATIAFADPIADIRVTHDAAMPAVSRVEATIDLGLIVFSFLHSWKRTLR